MRALVRDRYGPPEELRIEDVPTPRLGSGDVLVRVRAASVNAADVDYLTGRSPVRLAAPFRPAVRILGSDVAGTVEAVGDGVTRFRVGDDVIGDTFDAGFGTFAELARAPERALVPKPAEVSFDDASTLPQAAVLALQGLRHGKPVGPGDRVLVNGAGGGAGTFAVQLAAALGATVTGVDRSSKLELVRSLGASEAIDHEREDFTTDGRTYDRIIDFVSRRSPLRYRRVLSPGGTCVVVGGATGALLANAILGALISRTSERSMGVLVWRQHVADDIESLLEHLREGTVRPAIERTYRLDDAPEALRRTAVGEVLGKLVITP